MHIFIYSLRNINVIASLWIFQHINYRNTDWFFRICNAVSRQDNCSGFEDWLSNTDNKIVCFFFLQFVDNIIMNMGNCIIYIWFEYIIYRLCCNVE